MPDSTPSLMQQMREATWPQHQHAESRPLEQALAQGKCPKAGYVNLLKQRLQIHVVLERAWVASAERDVRISSLIAEELLQVDNLLADLKYFDAADDLAPVPGTTALIQDIERAARDNPITLLGHYYVFEGSKNGGRMLAKGLRQNYDLPERDGIRYFDPHGDEQRAMWLSFKARVDQLEFSDEERQQIIEAAKRTFAHVAVIDDELYANWQTDE